MKPDEGGLMHCAPKRNAANGPIAFTRPVASRIKTGLLAKICTPQAIGAADFRALNTFHYESRAIISRQRTLARLAEGRTFLRIGDVFAELVEDRFEAWTNFSVTDDASAYLYDRYDLSCGTGNEDFVCVV